MDTDGTGTALFVTNLPAGVYQLTAYFASTVEISGQTVALTNLIYAPATQTGEMTGGNQAIAFGTLANKTYGDADFTVSASASSGLAVSFSAAGQCTVSGNTVTITGAGSCTITASQAGDDNYSAASPVTQSFGIAKANQTITFDLLDPKTYGVPAFTVSATASSGLAVSFSAAGQCIVSGNTVTITGAGSCTITTSQAGDVNYDAVSPVAQSFNIAKATPVITWSKPADILEGTPLGATQLNATASVPGAFAYIPPAGTALGAGATQTLSVYFTPSDTPNYNNAAASVFINVTNVAPTVGAFSAPVAPVSLGSTISASASFTDPGIGDKHTASWDWGDGKTSSGIVTEPSGIVPGSVTGSHTYTAPGVYTVKLSVADTAGEMGTATFNYVVVYDPSGGFVTGGGWINSPAGAYTANPGLTGKATFGFNSKYQKGANVPTGDTQFQFQVANLNFKSTSYDWLVIAGRKGAVQGHGTINGAGNYGFMLTAVDGQVNGGGGRTSSGSKSGTRRPALSCTTTSGTQPMTPIRQL